MEKEYHNTWNIVINLKFLFTARHTKVPPPVLFIKPTSLFLFLSRGSSFYIGNPPEQIGIYDEQRSSGVRSPANEENPDDSAHVSRTIAKASSEGSIDELAGKRGAIEF